MSSHLNFTDPERFTRLLVTLAACSLGACILALFVRKAAQNVHLPEVKSEENEMGVEINQAYEECSDPWLQKSLNI